MTSGGELPYEYSHTYLSTPHWMDPAGETHLFSPFMQHRHVFTGGAHRVEKQYEGTDTFR